MMIRTIAKPLLLFCCFVIALGAYTRLADAGLGCPDWPGCYGYLTVPQSNEDIRIAELRHPGSIVEPQKAWPEMIHRYVAGILGIGVIAYSLYLLSLKKHIVLARSLIILILFQAILGLWTVTWKLHPVTVMLHLMGGFTTALLLFKTLLPKKSPSTIDTIARIIFAMILLQVLLGGWVSSNYAALICPDFPYCQGMLFPPMSFSAFNPFLPIGDNYQFGILNHTERVTTHMTHRYFAMVLAGSMLYFMFYCYQKRHASIKHIMVPLVILLIQLLLGILNVTYLLPMHIAVSHNFFGLLLLLSWLWFYHKIYSSS